jgi:hypothetical protein
MVQFILFLNAFLCENKSMCGAGFYAGRQLSFLAEVTFYPRFDLPSDCPIIAGHGTGPAAYLKN